MRRTLAGGSPCLVYGPLPPSVNEGRTVNHSSCGDTRKHRGKQNETHYSLLPEILASAAHVSALKTTLVGFVFPLAELVWVLSFAKYAERLARLRDPPAASLS